MTRCFGITAIALLLVQVPLAAACSDAVAAIASGYGGDAAAAVVVDSLPRRFLRHDKVYVFRPRDAQSKLPLICFFPGIGANDRSTYEKMLRHIAARGHCVLLVTYRMVTFPYQGATYRRMLRGVREASRRFAPYADTSRLGMIGHSFGASAIPSHMHRCLTTFTWGTNGAFMFLMAPHYVFGITQEELLDFPPDVKLVVEVFEDDDCNDHRLAKDIFQTIGIADSAKDFVVLRSDSGAAADCRLLADHGTPKTMDKGRDTTNALDYYGIWRYVDALSDCAFTGNLAAREMALGNGSAAQRYMGAWPDGTPVKEPIVSDSAPLVRPVTFTYFNWKHPWNVRRRTYRLMMPDSADAAYR